MYVEEDGPEHFVDIRNDRAAEYLYTIGLTMMYYDWVLNLPLEINVVSEEILIGLGALRSPSIYVPDDDHPRLYFRLHTIWGYNLVMTDEQVGLQTIAFLTYNGYRAYGIESTIHGYHNCNTFIPLQDAITAPWYFMQLTFETMMVAVSVFCLVRHARDVRRRYRRWDWNDLFATMIRDHTLYFVLYMVWGTMNGVSNLSDSSAPFINELLYNASNFWLGYI
ncbi:hypothetical protein CONPUDRAFT_156501 [Coniophora puteana RWD-64-598 SS2]|uniref:Uncharacterized protein n=1 Tax=Coniophora puteana (strain RWD-64-598) TaxID=741705 RepID=A0A5M3MH13_CONPW|nr:uncharacterized protein CONPUDRAFT_156501 [Coniophora puteana RWD-64-598 SS2]EIW78519.1 hypothetical protein CONPUDRAFT_156501 [Coniophora puteana RWD-64-598 SS2]